MIGGRGMKKRSEVILRKEKGRDKKEKTRYTKQLNTQENQLHKTVEETTLKLILFFYIKLFCNFYGLKPVLFFVFAKSL